MGLKCQTHLSLLYRKVSKGLGRLWICRLRPTLGVSGGHTFHRHCGGAPAFQKSSVTPAQCRPGLT